MSGVLRLGLAADAAERTIDLIVEPTPLASWARAGVAAHLEVTLEGTDAPQLAVPLTAVLRDGAVPVLFRRDPANPDRAIRLEADVGLSDGRWIVLESGVKEGDEVIIAGNYQLMLATSGTASKPGHFHSDGTFHDEEHK
jgi:multidrug efflux pump subunit AcrA (membrane-fusion protein)